MIPVDQIGDGEHQAPDRVLEVSLSPYEHEDLRFVTTYSAALRGRGDISIFAPAAVESLRSVPIVVLLHRVYSSHWAWFFKGAAHRTARRLIAQQSIRPMLLVAPSDGMFGEGSGYLRHSGRDYEAWIAGDVSDAIRRAFPCADSSSPVFLAGLSMGGYGALRIGAKYAGVFRGISAHSAVTTIEELQTFLHDPLPLTQIPAEETAILHWFEIHRHLLPPVRFDCGTGDRLLQGNRLLHEELTRRGFPHRYVESAGEHTWEYWRTHVESSLLFFEEILRGTRVDVES